MKLESLRKKCVGKKLKAIIDIKDPAKYGDVFRALVPESYDHALDTLHILFIGKDQYVAFIDFDSDGYRSGTWAVADIAKWTDTGGTNAIKRTDSVITDMEYVETNEKVYLMVTTDEYVIMMGQDQSVSYYPRNFLSVEDAKNVAIAALGAELVESG
jgi:hypothetical protein